MTRSPLKKSIYSIIASPKVCLRAIMNGNNSIIVLLSASLEIHNKLISVDFFSWTCRWMNYGSCVSSIYCLVFDPTRSGGDVNKTVPFELAGKARDWGFHYRSHRCSRDSRTVVQLTSWSVATSWGRWKFLRLMNEFNMCYVQTVVQSQKLASRNSHELKYKWSIIDCHFKDRCRFQLVELGFIEKRQEEVKCFWAVVWKIS